MNKKLITLAVAGALASPMFAAAAEPTPVHSFSYNVGVTSDYLFRGVSQTHGKPALQGGIDYAHSSGLYVGAWASTITWVKDNFGKGSVELDLYGGYKGSITGDVGYDVGLIHYNYPGKGNAIPGINANPNTTEVYGAISYKWLTAKYSQAISTNFIGWVGSANSELKSRGSNYLELNANYDMGDGWTLIGHVGTQKVKNSVTTATVQDANYTDWKVGVSKDVGFGVVTVAYSDTDAKGVCNATTQTNLYCWGTNAVSGTSAANSGFKDASRGTAVVSFTKAF
ncbi:MAG: TorF family putative porin [Rhodocyclaceae bacterium]|nr:TorF family putative porin [Rhodocyclaceae bacterium]MDZ4216050.1 TorF family putative porin [Rhodocyclaceae bacterium]